MKTKWVLGLLLLGVLNLSIPGQPQTTKSVNIQGFEFQPQTLNVTVGTTVVWTNKDGVSHTVTGNGNAFDSGNLSGNETFEFTFNEAGAFDYFCRFHRDMTGRIVVTASQSTNTQTGSNPDEEVQEFAMIHSLAQARTFPATLTVKQGIKVRLYNTASDGAHPGVVISSDENGTARLFDVQPFEVNVGEVTTVEFTPTQAGEFFISHRPHGHDIVGKLVVEP